MRLPLMASALVRVDVTMRWVLRIGAFALPLVLFWTTFDRFVLAKLLTARLLCLVLAALLLARIAISGWPGWKRTPIDLPLIAFIASAALASVFAINGNVALFGSYFRYEGLFTIVLYGVLFWLGVQVLRDSDDASGLIRSLLASGFVVSVFAVLQSVFGWGLADPGSCEALRPFSTLGNAIELGAFLALLLPVAFHELLSARSVLQRLIAGNVVVVIALAFLLTLARSAWIGAVIGVGVVLVANRPRWPVWAGLASVFGLIVALAFVQVAAPSRGALPVGACLLGRGLSVTTPMSGSTGNRLHVWKDSLSLIPRRPLVGYGPDSFGLTYPTVQTGDWEPGDHFDKTHADVLQVAVTQGLLGVAAYVWLIAAFVLAFWRARASRAVAALFGGWLAYELTMQVNFSWIPAATPFWLFAAAAMVMSAERPSVPAVPRPALPVRLPLRIAAACAAIVLLVLIAPLVVPPFVADADFYAAVVAAGEGRRDDALRDIAAARALAPEQSVYAVEAGNLDIGFGSSRVPAPDWARARVDYEDAARLGTFDPLAFHFLAVADLNLGRPKETLAAARRAVELNRFDPASQAFLAQLTSQLQ
jgi:O-antigen ligase